MAWTAPKTDFAPGDILNAAQMNEIGENLDAIGGAWTSYTPTWTNLTVGNATQTSAYVAAGKLYFVRIGLTFGSTTSISAQPEFTLPGGVSVSSDYYANYQFGYGGFRETGAGTTFTAPILRAAATASQLRFGTLNATQFYVFNDIVSATVPFTWNAGDLIMGTFFFEAA
jgi:hypothetical protein